MKLYKAIGVMSGTSLDGIDICYVELSSFENKYQIIHAETIEYDTYWRKRLADAIDISGESLTKLDLEYGHFLGVQILQFIVNNQIQTINFISFNEHTIFHLSYVDYTLIIGIIS